jgi:hypothetical protein
VGVLPVVRSTMNSSYFGYKDKSLLEYLYLVYDKNLFYKYLYRTYEILEHESYSTVLERILSEVLLQ